MTETKPIAAPVIYTVSVDGHAKLTKRIEKLNRIATKLGLGLITLESTKTIATHGKGKDEVKYEAFEVSITGAAPKIAGWTFVATLQHTPAGNIVRNIGREELPKRFRAKDAWCDHCKKTRARRDTFVVRNESGKLMQVGRTCLADFLGHSDPDSLATLLNGWDFNAGDEDEWIGGGGGQQVWRTAEVLEKAHAWTRKHGFVSRSKADEEFLTSTADNVISWLMGGEVVERMREAGTLPKVTREITAQSKEALKWIRSHSAHGKTSEYMHNLLMTASGEFVTRREIGILASGIQAWTRENEKKEAAKVEEIIPAEPFIGNLGQRMTIVAKVMQRKDVDGIYGVSTFVRLRDSEGHWISWKATNGAPGIEVGEMVTVKGTVTDRGTDRYNGDRPTTYMKRCVVTARNGQPVE